MTNRPGDINDPFAYQNERAANKTSLLPSVRTMPNAQTAGLGRCPHCGAPLSPGTSVCPECGEFLRAKAKRIRCRRCGQRASSSLLICPHCGRDLIAAPSRLLTWGAPALLVALFLALLVSRGSTHSPIRWTQSQAQRGVTWLKKFSDSIAPTINIAMVPTTQTPIALTIDLNDQNTQPNPAPVQGAAPVTTTNSQAAAPVIVPSPTSQVEPTVIPTAPVVDTPTTTPTATATPIPTNTALPSTATPTTVAVATATSKVATIIKPPSTAQAIAPVLVLVPTATPKGGTAQLNLTPTIQGRSGLVVGNAASATKIANANPTSTATKTGAPTSTPTLTATATPVAQQSYVVQAGDTLNAIAARANVDSKALMEANGLTPDDIYRLRPGQTLIIPGASATAIPAKSPIAAQTYTIRAGDTPIEIANNFDISVADLLAANNLSNEDARSLRVGQVLVIPGDPQSADQPTPSPSPSPASSPTPQAVTQPGPTVTVAQSSLRLDAPQLRSPENNTQISCSGANTLVWQSVPFMIDTDRFVIHLGFVNGRSASGTETITWVLEQIQPPKNTAWTMDNGLCALAPQNLGRQWRWYVEIIDASRNSISSPSSIWGFSWN